ncbi:hypothetical protein OUZ56_029681 [Daphnia magna]|uniref:Uncharacterized protein n=1 Tax=Daphnia magna TaxID=35525 RepID=A0ABR0B7K2_9CRUS|nr:hypothetical protein OUZ56_029681 [Daphnia magna]
MFRNDDSEGDSSFCKFASLNFMPTQTLAQHGSYLPVSKGFILIADGLCKSVSFVIVLEQEELCPVIIFPKITLAQICRISEKSVIAGNITKVVGPTSLETVIVTL